MTNLKKPNNKKILDGGLYKNQIHIAKFTACQNGWHRRFELEGQRND